MRKDGDWASCAGGIKVDWEADVRSPRDRYISPPDGHTLSDTKVTEYSGPTRTLLRTSPLQYCKSHCPSSWLGGFKHTQHLEYRVSLRTFLTVVGYLSHMPSGMLEVVDR